MTRKCRQNWDDGITEIPLDWGISDSSVFFDVENNLQDIFLPIVENFI
jgi:hypothetical protein